MKAYWLECCVCGAERLVRVHNINQNSISEEAEKIGWIGDCSDTGREYCPGCAAKWGKKRDD